MDFNVVIISAESNTQTMLRVVFLEEELLDVPKCQGVPLEMDTILVSQEGQPLYKSHTCLCLICEFGTVLCFSKVLCTLRMVSAEYGREHGGRGFRAGRTRLCTVFAWPISGESVQASTTCGDRRRRSCCLGILACPSCVGSLKPAIIDETAVGPLLTTSGRCQGESRRGLSHRVS